VIGNMYQGGDEDKEYNSNDKNNKKWMVVLVYTTYLYLKIDCV
jgi:hypothetical protein